MFLPLHVFPGVYRRHQFNRYLVVNQNTEHINLLTALYGTTDRSLKLLPVILSET